MMNDEEWIEKVLDLCKEQPDGITNDMFKSNLGLVDIKLQSRIINRLLAEEKITIHQKETGQNGKELLYKLNKGVKSKNEEEKIVLSIIENAGNKGIWTKDIRFKSNIPAIYLNKILKQMESKKLIKTVKSVNASKKKLYMIFDIEPDTSVTGGTWYSNQDFEGEFVDVLNQQCFRFLDEKRIEANAKTKNPLERIQLSYANSEEVWSFIKNLGISKVDLSKKDIESILQTLIFDQKIQCHISGKTDDNCTKLYRALVNNLGNLNNGLLKSPCGGCPVIKDCHEGGAISPKNCKYLSDWFEF